jgi:hypothetical protein
MMNKIFIFFMSTDIATFYSLEIVTTHKHLLLILQKRYQ